MQKFVNALEHYGIQRDAAIKAGLKPNNIPRLRKMYPDFDEECEAALDRFRASLNEQGLDALRGQGVWKGKPNAAILKTYLAAHVPEFKPQEKTGMTINIVPAVPLPRRVDELRSVVDVKHRVLEEGEADDQ